MKMEINVKKNGCWFFWVFGVYEIWVECFDRYLLLVWVKCFFVYEIVFFVVVGKIDNWISWGERFYFFFLFVYVGFW